MAHGSKKWPHTGAILCGGRSTRMGAPKHDLTMPDGRTMIQRVAESVGGACERLVISGPDDILPGLPHVHDLREDLGPLGGLEALLASGFDEQYLVVPCDLPRLEASTLQRLLVPTSAPITAFQLEGSDRLESMPMRISSSILDLVSRLLDENRRAVHHLLKACAVEKISIPADHADQLTNINTPEEFRAIAPDR